MKKLQIILPLALILCFMVGCQDKEAMAELEAIKAQAEIEKENIALVKRRYEAWNSGDVEAIKEVIINRGRKQTRSDNVGACLFGRNRV
jgi:hypothetical protein